LGGWGMGVGGCARMAKCMPEQKKKECVWARDLPVTCPWPARDLPVTCPWPARVAVTWDQANMTKFKLDSLRSRKFVSRAFSILDYTNPWFSADDQRIEQWMATTVCITLPSSYVMNTLQGLPYNTTLIIALVVGAFSSMTTGLLTGVSLHEFHW